MSPKVGWSNNLYNIHNSLLELFFAYTCHIRNKFELSDSQCANRMLRKLKILVVAVVRIRHMVKMLKLNPNWLIPTGANMSEKEWVPIGENYGWLELTMRLSPTRYAIYYNKYIYLYGEHKMANGRRQIFKRTCKESMNISIHIRKYGCVRYMSTLNNLCISWL